METRILVIDDEDDIRKIVSMILSSLGYIIDCAANASLGLEMFEKNEYSLIITDLVMPKISGLELIDTIRITNNAIPIIICSGEEVDCSQDNAVFFLKKPISAFELLESVKSFVNQSGSEIK